MAGCRGLLDSKLGQANGVDGGAARGLLAAAGLRQTLRKAAQRPVNNYEN